MAPHALGNSPPRRTANLQETDFLNIWKEDVEQYIIRNAPIRDARLLNLAGHDTPPYWVVVVSLNADQAESQLVIATAKKALMSLGKPFRHIQSIALQQWFVVESWPLTTTGSIDLDELRRSLTGSVEYTNKRWRFEIISLLYENETEYIDENSRRRILGLLWAATLKIDDANITPSDMFVARGGNPTKAIELSSLARQFDLELGVSDIMRNQKLVDMAEMMERANTGQQTTRPFDLLPENNNQSIMNDIYKSLSLCDSETIEDAFPCSPLQERLMELTASRPDSTMVTRSFALPSYIDTERFGNSWERVIWQFSNLRTRIVTLGCMSLQVVVGNDIRWDAVESLSKRPCPNMAYGSRLCRYALGESEISGQVAFVWVVHKAVCDDWTTQLVLQSLWATYKAEPSISAPLVPFSAFIYANTAESLSEKANIYWRKQLGGVKRSIFPFSSTSRRGEGRGCHSASVALPAGKYGQIATESIIRAAWAIVLARHCETDGVCFGVVVSGRNAIGAAAVAGPTGVVVPLRTEINRMQSIRQFLLNVQNQEYEMAEFEQSGLGAAHLDPAVREACDFPALLSVRRDSSRLIRDADDIYDMTKMAEVANDIWQDISGCPLFVQVQLSGDSMMDLTVTYETGSIADARARSLLSQLAHVTRQLHTRDEAKRIHDITIASPEDIEQMYRWNKDQAAFYDDVGSCPHERVMEQAKKTPEEEALYSTEITLTYKQLDDQSTAVAHHLIQCGVTPNATIPFCIEKSALAVIIVLGISKAAATFVHLDYTHPLTRRRALCDLAGAKYIITSPAMAPYMEGMEQDAIIITEDILYNTRSYDSKTLPQVLPSSDMYLIFSSGSTGTPKCIPMQHGAAMSTLTAQIDALAVPPGVRMLQFTSFNFDVSLIETFLSFFTGGTICVPTEAERLGSTSSFALAARVNHTILTPSFAQTMRPEDYPTLKTLVLFGEKLTPDLVRMWQPHLTLINSYGLTESGMLNTTKRFTSPDSLPTDVGRGFNCHCWIVEPDNHEQLAPLGCTGELVLHGFAMSRGFLNSPELTARAFPQSMPWRNSAMAPTNWKYNRTGDLARFLPDGSIDVVGRSDTQIKIRGRRVNVTEIETTIKQSASFIKHIAVDQIPLQSRQALIAFAELNTAVEARDEKAMFTTLQQRLSTLLPPYMVPSVFITLRSMAFSGSMKTDRRKLRQIALDMSPEELEGFTLGASEITPPTTEMEMRLRNLWVNVLHISPERIGKTSSFLEVGGDSINAIQLASAAQTAGLSLSAAQIFQNPRLKDMATVATTLSTYAAAVLKPFELIQDTSIDLKRALEEAQLLCSLSGISDIEDILPCSSLQEGLMAEEMKFPGTYTSHRVRRLPADVDIEKFRAAWSKTVQVCTNLRTRIVRVQNHSLQIVTQGVTGWYSEGDLKDWDPSRTDTLPCAESGFGRPLCQYGLTRKGSEMYFVLSLHHSVYDGWTLGIVAKTLQQLYENLDAAITVTPYNAFINNIKSIDMNEAENYWRSELQGTNTILFPPALQVGESRKRATHAVHTHPIASSGTPSVTKATILRAAWGILLANYSDSDDVCYGQVLSGRQAEFGGIESMPGLALATVPTRIHLDRTQSVEDMLVKLQDKTTTAIKYEQFGVPNISRVSAEAKEACGYTSLFAVQPSMDGFFQTDSQRLLYDENLITESLPEYLSYTLSLQVQTFSDSFTTYFTYDNDTFCEQQIEALAHQYAHLVEQLANPGVLTVGDISAAGEWDIAQIKGWNNEIISEPIDACVHELLSQSLNANPKKTAIVTSSGSMSYGELEIYSNKFAQYLVKIGVREGMIVPFLFEKSMWAIVAFIGIIKSGAAFLPLDVSYPAARRQILVEETEAEVMVVSPAQRESCEGLVKKLIELSPKFFAKLPAEYSAVALPVVSPKSPIYAFFTSGSTGKPKGIILEHAAVAMSVLAHIKAYELTEKTRILQFCSYMFDIIIIDTFATLIAGGTMCAPTEEERLYDCASFMNFARVNYAVLTPTFSRTLNPDDLATLETLLMGAEAIPKDVQDMWFGKVKLKYAYGPTEAAVSNTIFTVTSPDTPPTIIGKGFNTDCWIVDPNNHNRLTPVGCVGELVLHGHNLARGYLKNEAATEKAFPKDVDWMPRRNGDTRKFYKTGDLVKFRPDGNIEFLSRKDTQVKIRGRRIELGEIESAIKTSQPTITSVAVEVIRLESRDFLAAFIQSTTPKAGEDLILSVDAQTRKSITTLMGDLKDAMPPYMVPSVYIPIGKIPLLPSMKTDRKTLQAIGKALTPRQLTEYSFTATRRVKPTTEMEMKLRELWANILKRDACEIGKHDSFLGIGGDSITAMELAARTRKTGMSLTVQDIFRAPKLSDMALLVRRADMGTREIPVFGLLPSKERKSIIQTATEAIELRHGEEILDIYPSTPMQERLMAAAEKTPGSYIALYSFKLLQGVEVERFVSAWNRTVDHCANLRTRLVFASGKSYQITLRTRQPCISEVEDVNYVDTELKALLRPHMGHGTPLSRFKLVRCGDETFFLFAFHHSIFDGWSTNIMLRTLHDAYKSPTIPSPVPYTRFIEYIASQDEALTKEFWKRQLEGSKSTVFPKPSPDALGSAHDPKLLVRLTQLPLPSDSSITTPSVIRAAWAILLSKYCNSDDVCFSDTMSGRLAAVNDIEHMAGLTISIVPFRVRVNPGQLVKSFLEDVQAQSSEIIPYEQYGTHNIAKLGPGFKEATECGHAIVIQPYKSIESQLQDLVSDGEQLLQPTVSEDEALLESASRYDSFPLFVHCQLVESGVRISYIYNVAYMSAEEVHALSLHFDTIITQLMNGTENSVGDIQAATEWDLELARSWSQHALLPEPLPSLLLLESTPASVWVMDTSDTNSFAPIGCAGELFLAFGENSVLSSLNRVESSALNALIPANHHIVRTGHLVQYTPSGRLEYIGQSQYANRKGSKYTDVEIYIAASHASISSAAMKDLTVEASSALVALIQPEGSVVSQSSVGITPVTDELADAIQSIFQVLQKRWPSHMIPEYIIPVSRLLETGSDALETELSQLPQAIISKFRIQQKTIIAPSTKLESNLRDFWASILSLQANDISSDDNFFSVGGDSFSAIQLASQARRNGLKLTTRAVFQTPVLVDMAASLSGNDEEAAFTPAPFSLVDTEDVEGLIASVAQLCGIEDSTLIKDIYPCTAMQEGLMSLTVTQPGSYVDTVSMPLAPGVDVGKFKSAWNEVVRLCENTRTRIVLIDGSAFQVVVKEPAIWSNEASFAASSITYGSRLFDYSLAQSSEGTVTFSYMMHHSVYDGWVINLLTQTLESIYYERPIPILQPFSGFVEYVKSIDEDAAKSYWTRKLQDASPSTFPAKAPDNAPRITKTMQRQITFCKDHKMPVTTANIIRTAWALLMARYSGTDDICFGATVSGRQASVSGLDRMPGPMIASVPVHVKLQNHSSIMEFLNTVQKESSEDAAFEQFGLQNIAKLGQDAKAACDFSSLLIVQAPRSVSAEVESDGIFANRLEDDIPDEEALQKFFNYPLVAQCFPSETQMHLHLTYDASAVSERDLLAFSHQFEHIIQQICTQPTGLLSGISWASQWDIHHVLRSSDLKPASEECVQWRFEEQVIAHGNLPAINSWDGDFTYRELYDIARPLTAMLQHRGVGPHALVPICFNKSSWAIVAMIAIQLAGGAFVPLDAEAPIKRLEALISDTGANFILSSTSCKEKLASTTTEVIPIDEDAIKAMPSGYKLQHTENRPTDSSFVIFTSGTTGKPKGVAISHSAICSSADGYGAALNIGPRSRVFQFSSYTFDVAILDILVSLMRGACICVPSDYSRIHELAQSINSTQANWVFLTPTVANLLSPQDVPCLKTVCLGGEAVGEAVVAKWKDNVDLHGLYGPAESSICSWRPNLGDQGKSTNIGLPLSSIFWVVEPTNRKNLVPTGCVGELLIQGPLLAKGYLNAEEEDHETWLEDIDWLPEGSSDRGYLTGDLVRHNADGTFHYIGRKDSQIKLRGQRMEIGEIEHHLSGAITQAEQIVVDVVGSGAAEALAAFVDFGENKPSADKIRIIFSEALEEISLYLSPAMRPQYFIPMDTLPQSSTGKLDRRALKATLGATDSADLLQYSVSRTNVSKPCETPMELELRGYWSQVLSIPETSIGATDNFYSLGGDSIRIVSLVQRIKMAYGGGIGLSVFGSSKTTIESMAAKVEAQINGFEKTEAPMHDFYDEITSAMREISDIETLQQRYRTSLPSQATIFLTGATGYLGSELLHQLVKRADIAKIAVLVRASSLAHGMARVKATAETAGWWQEDYKDRIEVWLGDLGKEQLGLSGTDYSRLLGLSTCGNVDAIIHNGAVVNWSADFHALKAENITSTVQLLKAVAASPKEPKFMFVSGGAGAKRDGTQSTQDMCNELAQQNGYSQTKFISESIVCKLAGKLPTGQNRIAVIKPGLIIGTSTSGVANVDDFLWRLVAASVALGKAPYLGLDQDWVQLAAVDCVANSIIRPLFSSDGVETFAEITNGMRLSSLWQLVGEATGLDLPLLSYDEWEQQARRQMEEVGEKHPLWAVQDFLERHDSDFRSDDVRSEAAPCAKTAEAVRSSVRYLQRIGFIQEFATDFGQVTQTAIGRSGIRIS